MNRAALHTLLVAQDCWRIVVSATSNNDMEYNNAPCNSAPAKPAPSETQNHSKKRDNNEENRGKWRCAIARASVSSRI